VAGSGGKKANLAARLDTEHPESIGGSAQSSTGGDAAAAHQREPLPSSATPPTQANPWQEQPNDQWIGKELEVAGDRKKGFCARKAAPLGLIFSLAQIGSHLGGGKGKKIGGDFSVEKLRLVAQTMWIFPTDLSKKRRLPPLHFRFKTRPRIDQESRRDSLTPPWRLTDTPRSRINQNSNLPFLLGSG
jgi:hypothetical protein